MGQDLLVRSRLIEAQAEGDEEEIIAGCGNKQEAQRQPYDEWKRTRQMVDGVSKKKPNKSKHKVVFH